MYVFVSSSPNRTSDDEGHSGRWGLMRERKRKPGYGGRAPNIGVNLITEVLCWWADAGLWNGQVSCTCEDASVAIALSGRGRSQTGFPVIHHSRHLSVPFVPLTTPAPTSLRLTIPTPSTAANPVPPTTTTTTARTTREASATATASSCTTQAALMRGRPPYPVRTLPQHH